VSVRNLDFVQNDAAKSHDGPLLKSPLTFRYDDAF
jgi:hypothetical protein